MDRKSLYIRLQQDNSDSMTRALEKELRISSSLIISHTMAERMLLERVVMPLSCTFPDAARIITVLCIIDGCVQKGNSPLETTHKLYDCGVLAEERREENAVVLDYMVSGKSHSGRSEPVAQIMGEEYFTLLEAVPKEGAVMKAGDKVYIGREERDKISLIKTRITYNELTQTAKNELPNAIMKIITEHEAKFVALFNTAGPINIREHSLELLPGIGKKHLEAILKARNEKKFESFKDINERVALMQEPAKLIKDRIVEELMGTGRFYLFTKPYVKREDFRGRY